MAVISFAFRYGTLLQLLYNHSRQVNVDAQVLLDKAIFPCLTFHLGLIILTHYVSPHVGYWCATNMWCGSLRRLEY